MLMDEVITGYRWSSGGAQQALGVTPDLCIQAKIVAGYGPIMPTFSGQVSEESLIALVAYVKSLQAPAGGAAAPGNAPAAKQGKTK